MKKYLEANGNAAAKKTAKKAGATRDELVKAAQSAYASASKTGGTQYASATDYLASATQAAKDSIFDTWSESELKAYLDSYGVVSGFLSTDVSVVHIADFSSSQPVPQGSKIDELRAYARKQSTYFRYGTSSPTGTLFAKLSEGVAGTWEWVKDQLSIGADAAKKKSQEAADKAKEAADKAKNEL